MRRSGGDWKWCGKRSRRLPLALRDPLVSGVNVHRASANKSRQRLSAFAREFHRQAGGGGDRGDDGNAGRMRFLHHLKRGASAEERNVAMQRRALFEKRRADEL